MPPDHSETPETADASAEDPLRTLAPRSTSEASPGFEFGNEIGPYRILNKLGEGGMGMVYLAEQERPIRRRVAIKVIKSGRDSWEVMSRFEAERQTLALMQHPNIAQVLDAGTTAQGLPFFAMELVNGVPLTTYCDQQKLSIESRLSLFIQICKAVQHAHQKGIIHRDLKPSNVLVTVMDGVAIPKVIDFGLAKATGQQEILAGATAFTVVGQIVGTLQYMSPEQAGLEKLDIDTRTDIYSLGATLYELLTGSTPVDQEVVKNNSIFTVLELIREKDPQRPSSRLTARGNAAIDVSGQRQITTSKLLQILRGELDWIVMKALDKDRNRRYETADGLAEDIHRFISNQPVQARPPSTNYRLRKFAKQHLGLVLAGTLIFIILTTASCVAITFAIKSKADRDIAEQATRVANQHTILAKQERARAIRERTAQAKVTALLSAILDAGDPVFGNVVSSYAGPFGSVASMRDVVAQTTEIQLDDATTLIDVPEIRIQLLNTLGDINLSYGQVNQCRRVFEKSEQLCQQAGSDHGAAYVKTQMAIGICDYLLGDLVSGEQRLLVSLRKSKQVELASHSSPELVRDANLAKFVLAAIAVEHDKFPNALDLLGEIMQADPHGSSDMPMLIEFARVLAGFVKAYESEVQGDSKALSIWKAMSVLQGINTRGLESTLFEPFGKVVGAEVIYNTMGVPPYPAYQTMHDQLTTALGTDHFLTAFSLYALAITAARMQDHEQACSHYEELIALVDRTLGRKHPRFAMVLSSYARLLRRRWIAEGSTDVRVIDRVRQLAAEALEIRRRALGEHRLTNVSAAFFARVERESTQIGARAP